MATPSPRFSAQVVSKAFVEQYYAILNKCPEIAYRFYQESSLLGWPGLDADGDVVPVTTIDGIKDKIMSSGHINSCVETITVDSQESLDGGILIIVTGLLTERDGAAKKNFVQTFFLAKNEKGFFLLNDILRFVDVSSLSIKTATMDSDPSDRAVQKQNPVTHGNSDSPGPPHTRKAVENGNAKEALDLYVSTETSPEGAASHFSMASSEKACPIIVPANAKKLTYASMVTKKSPVTSPRPSRVSSSSDFPKGVPPTENSSASLGSDASKTLSPSKNNASAPPENSSASIGSDASKTASSKNNFSAPPVENSSASLGSDASKMSSSTNNLSAPPTENSAASRGSDASKVSSSRNNLTKHSASPSVSPKEARGIYIGRLPYYITKQEIIEVLEQFGPINRNLDSIQIRRHEDGFCCGFAEFEFADAAQRAIEAHHVKFGKHESYIAYKKSSANRGNNDRGQSPSKSGFLNSNGRGGSRQ